MILNFKNEYNIGIYNFGMEEKMEKRGIIKEYKYAWLSFYKTMPIFLKYQIITKLLFSFFIFPVFWGITQALISSKGIGAISNSEMLKYAFSMQGIIFLVIGLTIFLCSILIEICGYITISSRAIHNKSESSYKELLKSNFKQLPKMLEFGSLILILYIVVLVPLTGAGVTLSFMDGFRIPNFITSVIEGNALYNILYTILLTIMFILSIRWIFTFQFMVIGKQRPSKSMKNSAKLVKKNLKYLLKYFLLIFLINIVIFTLLVAVWVALIGLLMSSVDLQTNIGKIIIIALFILQSIAFGIGSLLFLSFELHHLTIIFYQFVKNTNGFEELKEKYPLISQKSKKSIIDKILQRKKTVVLLLIVSVVSISIPTGIFFEDLFRPTKDIVIVGHRGGGGFDIPENSISSIQKSIEYGAGYVEIDVQRTKDGVYIINHDKNFNRMAGEKRKSHQMSLEEIKKLDIGKNYPQYVGEKIITVEELLDYCKGKIGIYVELKGVTADKQMADEVIDMIKQRNMQDETIIMSLDYDLIKYVRKNYKDMKTGFVYFVALGNPGSFEADYIILEEDAATNKAIEKIHKAGKKAVVWTVNKQESMDKFASKAVDAIITDDVKRMKETLIQKHERTASEILIDMFFEEY